MKETRKTIEMRRGNEYNHKVNKKLNGNWHLIHSVAFLITGKERIISQNTS